MTGEEGRKTVKIMEAMYRSGIKNAPVRFPLPVEFDSCAGCGSHVGAR